MACCDAGDLPHLSQPSVYFSKVLIGGSRFLCWQLKIDEHTNNIINTLVGADYVSEHRGLTIIIAIFFNVITG